MIVDFRQHLIRRGASVREVLQVFDRLASSAIVFLVDENGRLLSSVTDGDIRRGLIRGLGMQSPLEEFTQPDPKFFRQDQYDLEQVRNWRANDYRIIPVTDAEGRIVDVVNFRYQRSYLPLHAVIMAGGVGSRLRPLTLNTPKPLLKVGDKPIVEHNIDRLRSFGVKRLTLSIKYLGEQLIDYFGNGTRKGMRVDYVTEAEPLGTIGAVRLIEEFSQDHILVMNSDLLTTINYEDMFAELLDKEADMIVATVPYEVKIPYGVIETEGDRITSLVEKPTYTYYSNAGIYIFRKEHVGLIPYNEPFGAPDLMKALYANGKKVVHFPILDYWLDVGKHADYEKAQKDVGQLSL